MIMRKHLSGLAIVAAMAVAIPQPLVLASGFDGEMMDLEAAAGTLVFGTVKGTDGRLLPGARVFLSVEGKPTQYVATVNKSGVFKSIALPKDTDPSLVRVRAVFDGYEFLDSFHQSVTKEPGMPIEFNVRMTPLA